MKKIFLVLIVLSVGIPASAPEASWLPSPISRLYKSWKFRGSKCKTDIMMVINVLTHEHTPDTHMDKKMRLVHPSCIKAGVHGFDNPHSKLHTSLEQIKENFGPNLAIMIGNLGKWYLDANQQSGQYPLQPFVEPATKVADGHLLAGKYLSAHDMHEIIKDFFEDETHIPKKDKTSVWDAEEAKILKRIKNKEVRVYSKAPSWKEHLTHHHKGEGAEDAESAHAAHKAWHTVSDGIEDEHDEAYDSADEEEEHPKRATHKPKHHDEAYHSADEEEEPHHSNVKKKHHSATKAGSSPPPPPPLPTHLGGNTKKPHSGSSTPPPPPPLPGESSKSHKATHKTEHAGRSSLLGQIEGGAKLKKHTKSTGHKEKTHSSGGRGDLLAAIAGKHTLKSRAERSAELAKKMTPAKKSALAKGAKAGAAGGGVDMKSALEARLASRNKAMHDQQDKEEDEEEWE